jgi:hypothetical protein
MNERRARFDRIYGRHYSRQHLVIDGDQLSGIARQVLARADHHCDALPDIAHPVYREWRPLGAMAFRAAHILRHHLGIEGTEPVCYPILPGQHGMDAWSALSDGGIDRADAGMRVRCVEEDGVGLAGDIDVGDEAAPPGQKARILFARHRLSNAELHGCCLRGLCPAPKWVQQKTCVSSFRRYTKGAASAAAWSCQRPRSAC